MHTREDGSISISLAKDLESTFTWTPPLNPTPNSDTSHNEPDSFTAEEVDQLYDEFEKELAAEQVLAMDRHRNSLGDVDIA